jgi:hypothetical protein
MPAAEAINAVLTIWALSGLLFAIPFLIAGVGRIDSQAAGTGLGFRLIILPGVVIFWPLLLRRWAAGRREPPVEKNAHRTAAVRGELR